MALTLADFTETVDCRLTFIARHGHDPMDMYACKSCGASLSIKAGSKKPPCQVEVARTQPEKR